MAAIELGRDAEDNGLATMLAMLMTQNLHDHPERRKILHRAKGRVAIIAEDADVAVTLELRHGICVVHGGLVGIPDVTLRGGFEQIGDLSRMEMAGVLPDPRGEVNQALWSAIQDGRLRIFGAVSNFPLLISVGELLAIHS